MPKTKPAQHRRASTAGPDPQIRIRGDRLELGPLTITFHRTLRIPDNDSTYQLPPSLGAFPLRRVADYADTVPASWLGHGGVFLPMYQREAMWMGFGSTRPQRPSALKVAVGKVCALSGRTWSERLHDGSDEGTQDYVVVPGQPWLDGINAGNSSIRQFVAMPLGMGSTVEGQVTGEEKHGGLQLCVFDPKPGFAVAPPPPLRCAAPAAAAPFALSAGAPAPPCAGAPSKRVAAKGAEMGLAAGGRMTQSIYPDPHGLDVWDQDRCTRVYVHLVSSEMWQAVTGERAPSTPVSAKAYAEHGLPWFELYDEHKGDIKPAKMLKQVKSVAQQDADRGFDVQDDSHVAIAPADVIGLRAPPATVTDGDW